jgi:hypothetical protein
MSEKGVMEEPQEEGALVLVNDCFVARRQADGFWHTLSDEQGGDYTFDWEELTRNDAVVVQLHQGEAGGSLRRERAIRVDIEHPRRKEKVGTYITHWADERLIDQAPLVWEGWTIVERWVTNWEVPS